MATGGYLDLASSGDFFMATDNCYEPVIPSSDFLLANGYRTTFEPLARGRPSPHRSAKANSGKLSRRRRSMRGARKAKAEESLKQGRCGTNRKS